MKQIVSMRPDIKGIAASGFGTQEDINESLSSGFMLHITKPIELSVLKTAINQAILSNKPKFI